MRSILSLAVFAAVLTSVVLQGCTVQHRSLMPGLHVHRASKPAAVMEEMTASNESIQEEETVQQALAPRSGYAVQSQQPIRSAVVDRLVASPPKSPARVVPNKRLQQPASRSILASDTTVTIERSTWVSLITVGAALLMWGYTPFNFLGYLIVLFASLLGAPFVLALIWGERWNWKTTNLSRMALSLVISGLVLSGVMLAISNIFGFIF